MWGRGAGLMHTCSNCCLASRLNNGSRFLLPLACGYEQDYDGIDDSVDRNYEIPFLEKRRSYSLTPEVRKYKGIERHSVRPREPCYASEQHKIEGRMFLSDYPQRSGIVDSRL